MDGKKKSAADQVSILAWHCSRTCFPEVFLYSTIKSARILFVIRFKTCQGDIGRSTTGTYQLGCFHALALRVANCGLKVR